MTLTITKPSLKSTLLVLLEMIFRCDAKKSSLFSYLAEMTLKIQREPSPESRVGCTKCTRWRRISPIQSNLPINNQYYGYSSTKNFLRAFYATWRRRTKDSLANTERQMGTMCLSTSLSQPRRVTRPIHQWQRILSKNWIDCGGAELEPKFWNRFLPCEDLNPDLSIYTIAGH